MECFEHGDHKNHKYRVSDLMEGEMVYGQVVGNICKTGCAME